MDRGKVTSSTLMANGPAFDEAIRLIPKYDNRSFGVHLNVTSHHPLTNDDCLGALLDSEGRFSGNIRRIRIGKEMRGAIYREWCAQIDRVRSSGVEVSHLDSHEHVHTIPRLFGTLKHVQKTFGIRKVRLTKNIYDSLQPVSRRLMFVKHIWNLALRLYYPTRTTDGFTNLITFVRSPGEKKRRFRTVELMVHPGGSANRDYKEEEKLLKNKWQRRLPFGVRLISYHDI